jgi:hypothetical protein
MVGGHFRWAETGATYPYPYIAGCDKVYQPGLE